MMMRARFGLVFLGITTWGATAPSTVGAQEPRLVGRVPDAARAQVDSILDVARAGRLPTEPLVDRALEGAAKGAPPAVIVSAVGRLEAELRVTREAFGETASAAELTAGASALRAGATKADLMQLRVLRPGQPLTIAVAVLADLTAVGVPSDTAIGAVLAMAREADDAEYLAFRRNVGRDIAQGASPTAALGVRLRAMTDFTAEGPGSGPTSGPRPRKP